MKTTTPTEHGGAEFTVQPIVVPALNSANTEKSDWMRLPKPKQRLWGVKPLHVE